MKKLSGRVKFANAAVRKAAKAMDKEYGRVWPSRINLDKLNLYSLDDCIIGQVEKLGLQKRGYDAGICPWPIVGWSAVVAHMEQTYELFFGVFSSDDSEWHNAWVKEIQKRLDKNK